MELALTLLFWFGVGWIIAMALEMFFFGLDDW